MAQIAGELSILYFEDGQLPIAEAYVRNALIDAVATNHHTQVIRWEGQLAKILHAQNRSAEAQAAVARAVAGLQHSAHARKSLDFAQVVRPIYSLYADLQLASTVGITESDTRQSRYRELQETLEAQKFAEVEDYFGEDCVTRDLRSIDSLGEKTAVLYPIILHDRLELLVSAGSRYSQYTTSIASAELSALITDFRINIQADAGNGEHLQLAQQLYRLLIAPIEVLLRKQRIKQLVFVPDGALRTIPLAALHDGDQYLIEKYALATTPGITLLAPQVLADTAPSAFAGGISESVQGFAALPGVADELKTLGRMLSTNVQENASFTSDVVKDTLASGKFSLVHLATHGQFNADHEQSFLLTYNGRVTLDDLSSTIALRPSDASVLELLVLSACETAAGDDRAALGLAGVALKAGARSAVATLWPVDDAATRALIERFYTVLLDEGQSRAVSLQQAQLSLIREKRFQHPAYWAPYLLIGNWL
jgi:CHAT domain-containing protein